MSEQEQQADQGRISGIQTGMTLRVLTLDNRLLFVGRVDEVQGRALQLSDESGMNVPNVIYNTHMKLRGHVDGHAITLEGVVSGSTEKTWRLEQLHSLQGSEQRAFFRQNAYMKAAAMCVNAIYGQTPITAQEARPVPCIIRDISAGGLMLRMKERYQVGDMLMLVNLPLLPGKSAVTFTCVVRRVTQQEQGMDYGCEFYMLTGEEQEELIQAVFTYQQQEVRQRRDLADFT